MATAKHKPRPRRSTNDATVRRQNQIIEQAICILEARAHVPGEFIDNTRTAGEWFRLRLTRYPHEVFAVAWLDQHFRFIAFEELFNGSLDECNVPPREVVRFALDRNASYAIFGHNHPMGVAEPSRDDIDLTTHLAGVLINVRVKVLDHFIVTQGEPPYSMATNGLVSFSRQSETDTQYRPMMR